MAISKQDNPQNNFVQGIVTEASPLSFPPNASLSEVNFKLNRDGTRDRRLGIDFEDGFVIHSTGYTAAQLASSTRSFYRWPYASGSRNIDIGVIQIGGYIFFCNLLASAPSAALLNGGTPINTGVSNIATFEYAIIGNSLIAVSSELSQPYLVNYNETTDTITYDTAPIQVRDTIGVDDGLRIDERPIVLSPKHRYNLVNQGWLPTGIESTCGEGVSPTDCVFNTFGVYPSNADQWSIGRIDNQLDADVKKFDPKLAKRYLINAGQVPRGHFVVDAFDRGASRKAVSGIAELPLDRETGRVRSVATYAGRAWYAGILSKVDGGDSRSPNFNGVIFFSQVMRSPIDLVRCYQEADPTSPDISDLVDTDGGVINIPEATVIVKLLAIKSSLFVFAENGIWEIRGDDAGFRATSFQVNKISGMGVSSYRSIVEVTGNIFFWSTDGIYTLVPNQSGFYDTKSITLPTIQSLYNSLPESARRTAKGYYDAANNKLRWLYYSEEAAYTGNPGPIIGGGGVTIPFDLQALLDAGVANILAGVGSDYRLNVDVNNAFVAFQHKDAVYNGNAGAGGIRPAIGLSSAGIAMGYNAADGVWHNGVAIEATGNATFAGTVAANSILANTVQLGSTLYSIQDIIDLLGSSPVTFDLQGALNAGVGYILAGTGGDYRMTVDPTNAFVAFHHKDARYNAVSPAPGAGQTAIGISASGIGMGFNDPSTGAWTNAVAITSAGNATFKGTIAANSIIANNAVIANNGGTTLQDMIDDIATFAGGAFNLQAALNAGVTNILAGTGADYRMTVDTAGGFVAFHHKDAKYNATATTGAGVRPAIGLSAAGIGMGYNRALDGAWVNAISISATGDALFAGTIAANSIITNSATINGVQVGTIQSNSSAAAIHMAATGNVHNVSLTQISGDLDDLADGATYFKTTAAEKSGAARADGALDNSGNYIRSLKSTRITVSDTNPTTGWVADAAGFRLYQSGTLTVNIPVTGSPSFSGNITGGGNIDISGIARFRGIVNAGGANFALVANDNAQARGGIYAVTATSSFPGVLGVTATGVTAGAAGVRGTTAIAGTYGVQAVNTTTSGAALRAEALLGAKALDVSGDSTFTGNTNTTGQVQCANFRINQAGQTGTGVATFSTTNKPGGNSTNQWIAIAISGGAVRYLPVWA